MAGGRPVEFTSEVVAKLEYAFSIDCSISEACLYADIDRSTFYRHAPEGSELYHRFLELRDKPVLAAKETIRKNIHNPETAKWLLERKRKGDYSIRTEQTGKDGEALFPKPILDVSENNGNTQNNQSI